MIQHGTDWNRHKGVGVTLLENWVEERAVGDEIVQERSDLPKLNRRGHQNLLVKKNAPSTFTSTHREDFSSGPRLTLSKQIMGKRRQLMEAEFMKIAIGEIDEPLEDRSAKEWVPISYTDYSHSEVYKPEKSLLAHYDQPSAKDSEKYAKAITFWSDYAVKGNGTAICSTDAAELKKLGELSKDEAKAILGHAAYKKYYDYASTAAVGFGKRAGFSTPIKDSLK